MSASNSAIRVEHLSKKFARSLKRAMFYGMQDIARAVFQSPTGVAGLAERDLRKDEFWALRDVSLDIQPGECVGIIGANGAGKSTLFSVIGGIYGPSCGRVEVRGRLQALIALGAGFHPMLTGRENIFINAAILGMRTAEIEALLEQIIAFAELADFIDMPVKNYSSGMLVRLGFSVAAHMNPDILLIDEVLAVGDAAFQQKCQEFSLKLVHSGKTILVVAHNMITIQSMCNRVVWLDRGRIVRQGDTHEVVGEYKKFMADKWVSAAAPSGARAEGLPAVITSVKLVQDGREAADGVVSGRPADVELRIECRQPISCGRIWLQLASVERDTPILSASMYEDGHYLELGRGTNVVRLAFPGLPLHSSFRYRIYAGLRDWACHTMLAESFATPTFSVRGGVALCENGQGRTRVVDTGGAPVVVPYRWTAEGKALLRGDEYTGGGGL